MKQSKTRTITLAMAMSLLICSMPFAVAPYAYGNQCQPDQALLAAIQKALSEAGSIKTRTDNMLWTILQLLRVTIRASDRLDEDTLTYERLKDKMSDEDKKAVEKDLKNAASSISSAVKKGREAGKYRGEAETDIDKSLQELGNAQQRARICDPNAASLYAQGNDDKNKATLELLTAEDLIQKAREDLDAANQALSDAEGILSKYK